MGWNKKTFDIQVPYDSLRRSLIDVVLRRNPQAWPVVPPASFVTGGAVRFELMGMDEDRLVYVRDDKQVRDEGWDAPQQRSSLGPLVLSYLYPDRPREGDEVLGMWWVRDGHWPQFFNDSWRGASKEQFPERIVVIGAVIDTEGFSK